MMRPLLIICANLGLCLCVCFAAQAQGAPPPQQPALPYVPGDQKTFDQGAAAFDAGDYEVAFKIFSELAKDYDLGAMRNVALMERKGLGTAKNPKAAEAMMEKAAYRGLPTAQSDLGVMLMDGEAGPPDEKAALPWLVKAAQAEHPEAQFRLGELYEEGVVVPRDLAVAELLYGAAARHGVPGAASRLMALKGWTSLPQGFMDGPDTPPSAIPAPNP